MPPIATRNVLEMALHGLNANEDEGTREETCLDSQDIGRSVAIRGKLHLRSFFPRTRRDMASYLSNSRLRRQWKQRPMHTMYAISR